MSDCGPHCSCSSCRSSRPKLRLRYAGAGRFRIVSDESSERLTYTAKPYGAVNPWAVCTASTGREDKEKYERCVQDVKAKHKIKRD